MAHRSTEPAAGPGGARGEAAGAIPGVERFSTASAEQQVAVLTATERSEREIT